MNPDEDVELEDATVAQAVAALLSELPKPVQDFVTGPERARIALSLSQKYNLHADQAGEFEHAFMFMLLGVSSPEEFVDTLTKAGISAESVRGLAKDVNEQVFVPLRKAEQSTRQTAPKTITDATNLLPGAPTRTLLPGSGEPVPVQQSQSARLPQIPPPSLVPPTYMASPQISTQMLYPAPGTPIYMWPAPPMGQWAPAPQTATTVPAPQPISTTAPETVHVPEPYIRPRVESTTRPVAPSIPPPLAAQKPVLPSDADPYREPVQ